MHTIFDTIVECFRHHIPIHTSLLAESSEFFERSFIALPMEDKSMIWEKLREYDYKKIMFSSEFMLQWAWQYPEQSDKLTPLYVHLFHHGHWLGHHLSKMPHAFAERVIADCTQLDCLVPHPLSLNYAVVMDHIPTSYNLFDTHFYESNDLSDIPDSFWHKWFKLSELSFTDKRPESSFQFIDYLAKAGMSPSIVQNLFDLWMRDHARFLHEHIIDLLTLHTECYFLNDTIVQQYLIDFATKAEQDTFIFRKTFENYTLLYRYLPFESMMCSLLYLGSVHEEINLPLFEHLLQKYTDINPSYSIFIERWSHHRLDFLRQQVAGASTEDLAVFVVQSMLNIDPAIYSIQEEWTAAINNDQENDFITALKKLLSPPPQVVTPHEGILYV